MRTCRWEIEARRTAAAIVPLAFLVLLWPQSADGKEPVKPQAVNLRVDHLVSLPPGAQLVDLRFAMRRTPEIFAAAARRIGLTPSEYRDVLLAIDRRAVTYGPLPLHLDSMSGLRAGRVYVVRTAVVPAKTVGWRIVLADGALVFIPQVCANLSLLRHADIADRTAAATTAATATTARRSSAVGMSTSRRTMRALIVVDASRSGQMMDAFVVEGRRYASLRGIFVQMGATVDSSSTGMTLTGTTQRAVVTVTAGERRMVVNGRAHFLGLRAIVVRHALFVPLHAFRAALAATGALAARSSHSALTMWGQLRSSVLPPPERLSPPDRADRAAPSANVDPGASSPSAANLPAPRAAHRHFSLSALHGYLEAALWRPATYNEFSAGHDCSESFLMRGALEIRRLVFSFDYRQAVYVSNDTAIDTLANHYTQFATIQGDTAFVPVFRARQSTFEARVGYEIAAPNVYVGASILQAANNYGYPALSAVGVGIEKLPAKHPGFNVFASVYVYPVASGSFLFAGPFPGAQRYQQRYAITTFDVGTTFVVPRAPVHVYAGYSADRFRAQLNAPLGQIHAGPYLGLGVTW